MPILPQPLVLNPLKDTAKVDAIDYTADFENLCIWLPLKNLSILKKNNLMRYVPGMTKPAYQVQVEGCLTKKACVGDTYKGHKLAEFNVKLTINI